MASDCPPRSRAPFDVIAHENDVEQHTLKRRSDGDLTHRFGEFAIAIMRPVTPTEKSPEIGFTPEWTPVSDSTNIFRYPRVERIQPG